MQGKQLTLIASRFADSEPVRVAVDGVVVSSAELTASETGTLDGTTITLPAPLIAGRHTVSLLASAAT